MRKVILDTSFILSCIRNRIDFFEDISLMGIQIIIPQEVLSEILRFKDKKMEARVAFSLIDKNPSSFERLTLGVGHVDKRIIEYANEHNDMIVATLDREIKEKIHGKAMVIREKKRLEIV